MTLRLATQIFFALLPFQFAISIGTSDFALGRIAVLILGAWLALRSCVTQHYRVPRGTVMISITLFGMWLGVSFFVTDVPLWTLRKLLFFTLFAPLFLVAVDVLRTTTHRTALVRAWIYGAGAAAIIALVQFALQFLLSLPRTITLWQTVTPFFLGTNFGASVVTHNSWLVHVGNMDLMRAVAFFPDPHIFAFFTGMAIPFAWMLYVQSRRPHLLAIALSITLANLLTFSRGGYMGLCGGGIVTIVLLWHMIAPRVRALMIGASITLLLFFLMPNNMITERFLSSFDATDYSSTHRITLWRDAIHYIAQHPLYGSGLGAYAHAVDPTADYRTPIYAHNTYIDIAAETGVPGIIFFCAIFLSAMIVFMRHRRDPMAFAGIIALSVFCTHAIFDTPLFSVHVFPILLLLFALASSYENTPITSQ